MIPCHRYGMKSTAAVRAGSILERPMPLEQLGVVARLLFESSLTSPAMVGRVVRPSARATHRLVASTASVEL